jgi:hypothetical protein
MRHGSRRCDASRCHRRVAVAALRRCISTEIPAGLAVFDEVLRRLRGCDLTVILSDGDVIFEPRKVEQRVCLRPWVIRMIMLHMEEALDDVERLSTTSVWGDKPRILAVDTKFWGERVTNVFVRQGFYAHDGKAVGAFPPADVTSSELRPFSIVTCSTAYGLLPSYISLLGWTR